MCVPIKKYEKTVVEPVRPGSNGCNPVRLVVERGSTTKRTGLRGSITIEPVTSFDLNRRTGSTIKRTGLNPFDRGRTPFDLGRTGSTTVFSYFCIG